MLSQMENAQICKEQLFLKKKKKIKPLRKAMYNFDTYYLYFTLL